MVSAQMIVNLVWCKTGSSFDETALTRINATMTLIGNDDLKIVDQGSGKRN